MPNKTLEKWEEKTINDVCIVERGSSPRPIKDFITTDNNGVNWIKIGDCSGKYVTNTAQKITQEGAKKSRYVKVGDFIISNSMSYGKPYILKIDGYIHDGWFVLRLNNDLVNTDYFYYLLSSNYIREQYDALATGAIVQNISSDLIKKVTFKLPPLQEQQRIVKILNEAFENIEKARQNVLQNLNNAKELFESYLKKYFEIGNSAWDKYKLSAITTKIGSGATPLGGRRAYIDSGISLIRSMNVYDREFIYEGLAHINETQAKQLDVVTIQENDVLLNITGASVARCCVVPNDVIPARVNQHVSIIRPKQNIVLSRFLCYLLTSNYYKNKLLKDGEEGGATRQALTKMGLEQFEVYIPKTLEEQQQIVQWLDELQEQTKKLEQIYEQKIKDLDELKQSILQKAFNGEL